MWSKRLKNALRGFSALGCQKGLSDQSQNLAMSFGYVFLHEKLVPEVLVAPRSVQYIAQNFCSKLSSFSRKNKNDQKQ